MNQDEINRIARREVFLKKMRKLDRMKVELQHLKKSLSDEEYNRVGNKIIDVNDSLTTIRLELVEIEKEQ